MKIAFAAPFVVMAVLDSFAGYYLLKPFELHPAIVWPVSITASITVCYFCHKWICERAGSFFDKASDDVTVSEEDTSTKNS